MAQTGKTSFGTKKDAYVVCVHAHTTFLFIQSNRTQTKRGLRRRNDDIYKQWGNELTLRFYVDQHKMILLKDTIVISIQISI